MGFKIGRNDPCPCGSGKKYKQCCANASAAVSAPVKSHDGAVERALEWLMSKHRKAVHAATEDMLFGGLNDDEMDIIDALNEQTRGGIDLNATEWLLAEGFILIKGEHKRVSECLLGLGGPLFTVDQRHWITQLSERPLRLYVITDVIPGKQITVCDSLDTEAAPIMVREVSGSRGAQVGMHIGLRIMQVEDYYELSGAMYPFSRLAGPGVIDRMLDAIENADVRIKEMSGYLSYIIRHEWLEQYYAPPPLPTMMDAYSGEPILLITDDYRVTDWDKLAQSLASQSDVEGMRASGWDRLMDCEDGQVRTTVAINIEKGADRISLFYKTQTAADSGRLWFDALTPDSVEFIAREITDPKGAMANRPLSQGVQPGMGGLDLSSEMVADLIEQTIHRIYANWADESLDALDNKTPRQAIKTQAGLERVKGLIRSYEDGEQQQAEGQGRRDVSYEFLWDALGIED
jgi:hypothetical protein